VVRQAVFTPRNDNATLAAPIPQIGQFFGYSSDFNGAMLAAGAPFLDYNATDTGMLEAVIFDGTGNNIIDSSQWVGAANHKYGTQVAVRDLGSTKLAVATIPGASAICRNAYISGSWDAGTCLTSTNVGDVAIDSTGALIGTTNKSQVLIFSAPGGVWQAQVLSVPGHNNIVSNDVLHIAFGKGSDDNIVRIIASAPNATTTQSGAGKIHIWKLNAGVYTFDKTLSWGTANSHFGYDISADGTALAITAKPTAAQSFVKVYRISSGMDVNVWDSNDAQGAAPSSFGTSVTLRGNYMAVGEPQYTTGGPGLFSEGRVFTYQKVSGTWTQKYVLTIGSPDGYDYLGSSIGISGTAAWIGAPDQGAGSTQSGSMHRFSLL
jgi:hypothetical protein